ncbi:uncharacterized protein LOC111180932 [Delphinapterus leucas]|uniref:Uncharacterized protein LOC111180932 n=1 Tax=Delphinapterus leucas TaxID=9749 RepID=A0A7F8KBP6_DELLE|nr:uncharacterized protein LOC111180932 [Delphinapterus leucas]
MALLAEEAGNRPDPTLHGPHTHTVGSWPLPPTRPPQSTPVTSMVGSCLPEIGQRSRLQPGEQWLFLRSFTEPGKPHRATHLNVSEPTFLQPAVNQTPDRVLSSISRPIPQFVVPAPPPLPPEQDAPRVGLVHCSSPSRAELILLALNMRAEKGGLDPPPGGTGRLACSTALQLRGPFSTAPDIIQCWRRPPLSSATSLLLPARCPSPKPAAHLAPCRGAPSSPHSAKSSQWTSMGFSATFQHKPEADAGGCPGPEEEAPGELRATCWHVCSFEPPGEKSCIVACSHVSKTIVILTPAHPSSLQPLGTDK